MIDDDDVDDDEVVTAGGRQESHGVALTGLEQAEIHLPLEYWD